MSMPEQEDHDFQEYIEESQEDTGPMVNCANCGNPVHSDALRCLYCGEELSFKANGKNKLKNITIFALVIILILLAARLI